MKAKKNFALFLILSLCMILALSLGVSAETAEAADQGMHPFNIASLITCGVVLVIVAVLCIVKREKLVETLRAYKSEAKKVTWFPWKSVWRCTVFVLVCIAVIAVVVIFLDIAFLELQDTLGGRN